MNQESTRMLREDPPCENEIFVQDQQDSGASMEEGQPDQGHSTASKDDSHCDEIVLSAYSEEELDPHHSVSSTNPEIIEILSDNDCEKISSNPEGVYAIYY